MAMRAGVPLKDMEMMQFHPTTLAPTGVLITEGCRGEGAYLLNCRRRAVPQELRPECDGARQPRRHLAGRADRDRRGRAASTATSCSTCGISERRRSWSACTAHASCRWCSRASIRSRSRSRSGRGRITTWAASTRDSELGKTELEGLYAAGECACVSVHGANRLGGNALMETITYGRRAGAAAADWALTNTTVTVPPGVESDAQRELKTLLDRRDGERPWQIRTSSRRRCTRTSASSGARSR